jgi:hypothetical protein
MVDVPLPLASPPGAAVTGVTADGGRVQVPPPPRLTHAVQALGLGKAVGYLRMLQVMVQRRATIVCNSFMVGLCA